MIIIGIELKEGTNNELVIDDILEDGAAFNDGFLTVSILKTTTTKTTINYYEQ